MFLCNIYTLIIARLGAVVNQFEKNERKFEIYMRKGFLKIFACLFFLIFSLGVFAACDTGSGLEYEKQDGGYKVVGIGDYEDAVLVIPETYKGKPVVAIGAEAFTKNKEIGFLEIPDSVTVIEDKAFASCTRLEGVTMGNGVTTIGKEAFAYCDSLKSITFSNSLTKIDDMAFYTCRKLLAISFPDSLETIGKSAFAGASDREVHNGLQTVNFGKGLKNIGENAFLNCANLLDVIIPDGAPTVIAKGAFMNCSRLRVVDLGDNVLSIGESAFSADSTEEGGGLRLREAIIGNKVHTIGASAFYGCRKMSTVTLGKGLQNIGEGAFYKCQVLREVINDSNLLIDAGSEEYGLVAQNAWDVHTSDAPSKISHDEQGLVFYNEGSKKILISIILNDSTDIVIPDDVTEIAQEACYNEQMLTGVVVGNGCVKIGSKAFGNCYNIRTLDLSGASLTTIEANAFYNNAAIYSVILGANVQSVGTGAFRKKEGWDGFKEYRMYYLGTPEQWQQIQWGDNNLNWFERNGAKYGFYSEEQPTDSTKLYWRYVADYPRYWE